MAIKDVVHFVHADPSRREAALHVQECVRSCTCCLGSGTGMFLSASRSEMPEMYLPAQAW